MKPVRVRRNQSLYEVEQPFDLFDDFEVVRPKNHNKPSIDAFKQRPASWKHRWKRGLSAGLVFVTLVASIALTIGVIQRYRKVKIPVFVELRALSSKGHPVTGADVNINGKSLGVTDSFGEWRRYMRLMPEDKLTFIIRKQIRDEIVVGRKIVAVPEASPDRGDGEIKLNIGLSGPRSAYAPHSAQRSLTMDTEKPTLNTPKIHPVENESVSYDNGWTQPAKNEHRQKPTRPQNNVLEEPIQIPALFQSQAYERSQRTPEHLESAHQTSTIPLAAVSLQHLSEIDISYQNLASPPASLMAKHQSSILRERIFPEIMAQAAESGLSTKKGAEWKLNLSYLPHGGMVGFILAEIRWVDHLGHQHFNSFISHFSKTIEDTARNLLRLTALHVSKAYEAFHSGGSWYIKDQSPQLSIWRLNQHKSLIDTSGATVKLSLVQEKNGQRVWHLRSESNPFCSQQSKKGRCILRTPNSSDSPPIPTWKAHKLLINTPLPAQAQLFVAGFEAKKISQNVWQYWADDGKSMNLTVVYNGKILYRGQVTPDLDRRELALNLNRFKTY